MTRQIRSAVCAALLFFGCSSESSPLDTALVVDGAGIRIVTHSSPPALVGSLGDTPIVQIGAGQGDTITLYRVNGGILTEDGTIVLANAGQYEILYLTRQGDVFRRVGRKGDGPGEFNSIDWMQARTDGGVHIYDSRTRRLTALGREGELLWSRDFRPEGDPPIPENGIRMQGSVIASTDEGAFLAYSRILGLMTGTPGPLTMKANLRRFDPDHSRGEERGDITVITMYETPSGPQPVGTMLGRTRIWWSGHSDRLAYTESEDYQIEVFDGGNRTMRIRELRPRVPFEPDSIPEGTAFVAESTPAYQKIVVDSEHRIWARALIDNANTEWRVFGPDGLAVGILTLPEDAEVLDANESRILLLRHDEFDVESVELWDLTWTEKLGGD